MSCSSASRDSKPRKIIIPKGSIHPNETVIIEIPSRLRNNSTVLAKRRASPCSGAYAQIPHLPLERGPARVATPPPCTSVQSPNCLSTPRPTSQQQNSYEQYIQSSQTSANHPSYRMPGRQLSFEESKRTCSDSTAGSYGRQPVANNANICPSQTSAPNATYTCPAPNATYTCPASKQSPWIKRREKLDLSFQPPFASTPTRAEDKPCGVRCSSAPIKPVASPASFYGKWNESYGGCPANFQPYQYPDHVSAGEYISPIQNNCTPNTIASNSSTEAYTEDFTDFTEENDSSGEIDDELMGRILRGEIGRVLVWPTPPDAAPAAANVTYNRNLTYNRDNVNQRNLTYNRDNVNQRNLTYNRDNVNQGNLTYIRGNLPGGCGSSGETSNELMGRHPVQSNPSQNPRPNATYTCNPPSKQSPWLKRKENPDISFQPPFASTPARGEGNPCGMRNVSAPVKPVASPASFYGNWNESYGGCPANFQPYKYPDHVSVGQHMSPIERDLIFDRIASSSSIETFTEEITEEYESSGSIDDELMGKILRGEIGRVLVWPTPPDAANAAANATYNRENSPPNRNNLTFNVNETYNQPATYTVAPPNDCSRQPQQTYVVNNSCQPCPYNQSSDYDSPSTTSARTYTQEFTEDMYDSSEGDIDDSLLGKVIAGDIGRVLVWPTPPDQAAAEGNICNKCAPHGGPANATHTVSKSPCCCAGNQTYPKNVNFDPDRTGNLTNFSPVANSTEIENNLNENNNYTYNIPHNATESASPTSESSDNNQNAKCCCSNSTENSFKDFAPIGNSTGIDNSFDNFCPIANSTNVAESLRKTYKKTSKRRTKAILSPQVNPSNINKCPCAKKGKDANIEAEVLELQKMEAAENTMLQTNLRNWQEARRKLILDTANLTSSSTSTNYNGGGCPS